MSSAPPRPWTPDVELPRTGAAKRIAEPFADLSSRVGEPIGSGSDDDAYRMNSESVFRVPKWSGREVGDGALSEAGRVPLEFAAR